MPLAIFDLDGTLLDSAPDIHVSLNRVLEGYALAPFTLAEVTKMIGDGARTLVEKAFAARGAAFQEEAVKRFLTDYEPNSTVLTRPYPGMVEALEAFGQAGWRRAICTNKPIAATWVMLDALDLRGYFELVLGGDSLPVKKPDPGHVRGVLEGLGMSASDAVMIGDHQNDIRAAAGAGVRSVFAAWGYGDGAGADLACATAADLPDLLITSPATA